MLYLRMKPDHKHIAFLLFGLTGGGVPRITLNLSEALAMRNYKVDLVVVDPKGPLRNSLTHIVNLVPLRSVFGVLPRLIRDRKILIILSIPSLIRYLRSNRPAVLIAADHWINFSAIIARFFSRTCVMVAASQRMNLSTHAARKPFLRFLASCLYPKADIVIAVSEGVAADLSTSIGLSKDRIATIYNPVVTSEMIEKSLESIHHDWFIEGAPPVILGAGRLVEQKDFHTLLRAFSRVRRQIQTRLIILGDGRQKEELQELAGKLGVSEHVLFPGFASNPYPYMVKSAVFVLSSKWEGLPSSLIEALACGCPVVSTDCHSGPMEILDNGKFGPLVPIGDDCAMAKAILSILRTSPDREKLRERGKAFCLERAVSQYLKIIDSAASSSPN
jgi:glycosyltransferase involved in cell wall biosynthesis